MLGKSPAMPDANGANSGYLIVQDGYALLLECGSGVFSKLRARCDPVDIDAVLITHLHADHTLDLFPFSHALSFHGRDGHRPQLWAPPGSAAALRAVGRALGMDDPVAQAFALTEYDPDREHNLGPFTLNFREVPHYVSTWACDLRSPDGRRLTFGADCGPNDVIVELARDTDLLMLEATEGAEPHPGGVPRGHLTGGEAGELARRAGARRLLVTHYSDLLDSSQLRAATEGAFGRAVELAVEGAHYIV